MTAKVIVKGNENSKERAHSIYRQLHLYPFSLKTLGWGIAILGPSFTVKTYRSFYLLTIFVFPLYSILLVGISLKAILIALLLVLITITYLMAGNWYFYGRIVKDQPSKEKEKIKNGSYGFLRKVLFYFAYILMYGTNTSRDLRVVAFYQVCRNLKTEQALKHIWPSYVFRIIERLVNRIKNN